MLVNDCDMSVASLIVNDCDFTQSERSQS